MTNSIAKLVRPAGITFAALCLATPSLASSTPPLLGPPLAARHAPPKQPSFRDQAAGLALFLREASARAQQTRIKPDVKSFAKDVQNQAEQQLAKLGVVSPAMPPKWKNELDQLNHLPARYWSTRYANDVKRAMEQALRLCQNYARNGGNVSTRSIAAHWAGEIRNDIPRAEQLSRAT